MCKALGGDTVRVTAMARCDGTLYATLMNTPIGALRASDGAPIWRAALTDGPIWLTPLVG